MTPNDKFLRQGARSSILLMLDISWNASWIYLEDTNLVFAPPGFGGGPGGGVGMCVACVEAEVDEVVAASLTSVVRVQDTRYGEHTC